MTNPNINQNITISKIITSIKTQYHKAIGKAIIKTIDKTQYHKAIIKAIETIICHIVIYYLLRYLQKKNHMMI